MNRRSIVLGVVASFGTSAFADTPREEDPGSPIDPAAFLWPESLGAGVFGRVETAQISDDALIDVVIARGPRTEPGECDQTIVMAYGPSIHRALCPLPGLASDFAIVRGAGPYGRDAIAYARANGLALATLGDGAAEFTITDPRLPAFAGARRLRAADVDGNGIEDLVALDHDGASIHIAFTQDGGHLVAGPSFKFGGPLVARDLVVLNPLGAKEAQFAVLAEDGLRFCGATNSGSALSIHATYPADSKHDSIFALTPKLGASTDVAWITGDPSSQEQWLAIVDPHSIDPNPIRLGNQGARALVCEDLDGDADRDALISREVATGALAYFSDEAAGGYPFDGQFAFPWVLTPDQVPVTDEPQQAAWPAVADLDGDGARDVFFACQSANRLGWTTVPQFVVGSTGTNWRLAPTILSAAYQNEPVGVLAPTGVGTLRLAMKAPGDLDPQVRLHVVAWRQPGHGAFTESVAKHAALLPIPPSGGSSTVTVMADVPIDEVDPYPFPAIHWIATRFVTIDPATQRIDDVGEATLVAFAVSDTGTWNGPSLPALLSEPSTGTPLDVEFYFGGFSATSVLCGGIVPKASIPFFPPNEIPVPHPPTSGGGGGGGGGGSTP